MPDAVFAFIVGFLVGVSAAYTFYMWHFDK